MDDEPDEDFERLDRMAKSLGLTFPQLILKLAIEALDKKEVAMTFENVQLGKKQKKEDPRTLKLAKYLPTKLPAPPKRVDYVSRVFRWPMYMNDQLGICGPAMAGHLEASWPEYATTVTVTLPDEAILKMYEDVGGYVPGDPSTDNGVVLLDLLNYWRKVGVGGHKIVAFAEVDPTNKTEVKTALNIFGGLAAGVQLPLTAQTQIEKGRSWTVNNTANGQPGTWGGHAIPYSYYDGLHLRCVTWGQTQALSWGFQRKYTDELYAIVTEDWLDRSGKSPLGIDENGLLADLKYVTA